MAGSASIPRRIPFGVGVVVVIGVVSNRPPGGPLGDDAIELAERVNLRMSIFGEVEQTHVVRPVRVSPPIQALQPGPPRLPIGNGSRPPLHPAGLFGPEHPALHRVE